MISVKLTPRDIINIIGQLQFTGEFDYRGIPVQRIFAGEDQSALHWFKKKVDPIEKERIALIDKLRSEIDKSVKDESEIQKNISENPEFKEFIEKEHEIEFGEKTVALVIKYLKAWQVEYSMLDTKIALLKRFGVDYIQEEEEK